MIGPIPDFTIRPCSMADVSELLGVYRQCEDFLALGPVPHASEAMIWADIKQSADEDRTFCGIFSATGAMIGVVDFAAAGYGGDQTQAFIALLMLAQPYRGRGLGTRVMQAVEAEIESDQRVTTILADVQVNNPDAQRFWMRMNYRITGNPKLQSDGTTVWLLRKDLDRT